MIIIEMNGGLGNQLQQYALYEKFKALGKEVKLDTSWFTVKESVAEKTTPDGKAREEKTTKRKLELGYFLKVTYEVCTIEEKQNILGNSSILAKAFRKLHLTEDRRYTEHQMYDEGLFKLENRVLTGYWACEAYYGDILPALRQKLVFPPSDNPMNGKMKKQMGETNAVSIHLRRGDYLTPDNQQIFGGICTRAYYERAMEYIEKRVDEAHFYVFSDEPDYAQEFMEKVIGHRSDYTIVDINHGKDSFYDINLMSQCRHHICANSTFSFWGARLNARPDRIAVRPLKQKNGVDWYKPEAMKRLWPGWICIDEGGKVW